MIGQRRRRQRVQPRRREIGAQIGQQQAHRAQDAGIARHQDAADLQLLRQPRGVQRAGAAERHQRVVARIVAALHADHADRARHVGGDDGDDALRGRHRIQAQRRRQPLDRRARQVLAHRHAAAEQMRRVQRLQHDIGVGDRRFGIAARRSRPARDRRRHCAARPSAGRRYRHRRSSRRRRRPCGCPASAP